MTGILKPFAENVEELHKMVFSMTENIRRISAHVDGHDPRISEHDTLLSSVQAELHQTACQVNSLQSALEAATAEKAAGAEEFKATVQNLQAVNQKAIDKIDAVNALSQNSIKEVQRGLEQCGHQLTKLDKADAISKTGIQGNQENIESLSAALENLNKKHSSLSDAVKSDKAAFDSHVQKHSELVQELKERHERFKAFEAESLESHRKFCAGLSNLESRMLQIQGNMAQNRAEAQKMHDDSVRVLSEHLEVHDEKLRSAAETFQEHDRRLSLQQEQVVECGENTSKLVKHSDQKRIMDVQSLRNEVDQTSADNSRHSRLISQLQDIIYVRPPSGDAKNHVETLLADMSMTLRRATRLEGLLGLDPLTEDGDDDAGKMVNGILLSNLQIEDFKKSFSAFDSDSSGSISVSELNSVLKNLGYELEDDMVELIVRDIDPDHSGEIVFDEFCSMMSQMLGPDGKVDVNGYLRHLSEEAKRDAKQNQMTELLPFLKRDVEQHTSVIQLEQSKLSNTTQRVRSLESDQSALALEVDKLRKGVNANNEYWKGLSQGLKETKRTVTIHGDGAMLPSPTNLRNLPPLELRASTSPSNATRSARS
jgi:Ca2+-binding EF-hand superfamily protein